MWPQVVRDAAPLDTAEKHIFCYLPHGMLPIGCSYLPHLPGWRAAFPGIQPRTLTASVMHSAPFIRDLSQWMGFASVSWTSFERNLSESGAVLFCPGGQSESLHASAAWRPPAPPRQHEQPARHRQQQGRHAAVPPAHSAQASAEGPAVRLCTRHKGFARMALQQGAALVPVLVLGEALQVRNAVHWPWLQRFTYRRIGAPLPPVFQWT